MSDLPEKVGPVPLDKPWHQFRAFMARKAGPLPIWAWTVLGGLTVGLVIAFKGNLPGLGAVTGTAPEAPTAPSDSGLGGGSGGDINPPAPPPPPSGGATPPPSPPPLTQGTQQSDSGGSQVSGPPPNVDGGGLFGPIPGSPIDVTQRAGERSTEGQGVPYVAPAPTYDVTQRAGERSTEGAGTPAPTPGGNTSGAGPVGQDVTYAAQGRLGGGMAQLNSINPQRRGGQQSQ